MQVCIEYAKYKEYAVNEPNPCLFSPKILISL